MMHTRKDEKVIGRKLRELLASCRPAIDGLDWALLEEVDFAFIGAGAGNRPLAEHLAYLGMHKAVVLDPKPYKELSIVSQCAPEEVGRNKAEVVAERLRGLGVDATGLAVDVHDLEPGWLGPKSIAVCCVDQRHGDTSRRGRSRKSSPLSTTCSKPATPSSKRSALT